MTTIKYYGFQNYRQTAFTLLEVLIAASIAAVLMIVLTAGLDGVIRDWQKQNTALDVQLDNNLLLLQLERAIEGAFPHLYFNKKHRKKIFFIGKKNTISWVSTFSAHQQTGLTLWKLENSKKGVQLYLSPAYGKEPEKLLEKAPPLLLLENYHVRFHYLEKNKNKKKQWLDKWEGDKRRSLPLAVHIVFQAIKDKQAPLQLIAPIFAYRHPSLRPRDINRR